VLARLVLAAGLVFILPIILLAGVVSSLAATFLTGGSPPNTTPGLGTPSMPSMAAQSDIPVHHNILYQQAATACPGLDWTVLAGIGKIETNHGRSNLPGVHSGHNGAGAEGPMQFLPTTFARYAQPVPPGGANPPSPYDQVDADYAAARLLCDNGAPQDIPRAVFAYNHDNSYVRDVLAQAQAYRAPAPAPPAAGLHIPPVLAAGGWVLPTRGQCSSGFGPRSGGFHEGQDIAAPIGTPILAAASGTVIDSGPATGFGLWVRIQHPGGVVTVYGHNNVNLVQKGQMVLAGQPIAEVGDRGESTGPHLHFQIEVNGKPVDPLGFYQQQSAPPLCG
jgi:hypothetical protein